MSDAKPSDSLAPELELARLAVLQRVEKIVVGLTTHDPLIAIHCQEIQKALLENEELVHILPDEKVRQFMAGMKHYKNVQLIKEAEKKPRKGKVTADDL